MKPMKLISILSLFFLLLPASVSAEENIIIPADLPFENLTAEEISLLRNGERLFRIHDSYKDIRLKPEGEENLELISIVNEVKPNFLAEIIMVIPVDPSKNALHFIRDALTDVLKFDTIPYYSKDGDKWYKLFYDSEIVFRETVSPGVSAINVNHRMKPFRTHENRYEYSLDNNSFVFFGWNVTPLYYRGGIRTVRPGNFINLIVIREEGDNVFIYGVGGAKAFTFFGLFGGEKIETAFIGRVEAFFTWFYDEYITELL